MTVLSIIALSPALASASCLSPMLDAALSETVAELRQEIDARGLSAAVILPGGCRWSGTDGEAAPEVPATPATVFETGSITKLYTATLVLRLAERGELDLDAPLSDWVREVEGVAELTLRHLLQHTSGLYNVHDDPEFMPGLFMDPSRDWRVEELLERVRAPYFAPGAGWRYSNTNYLLLGLVVERATGQSFADHLRADLLEPLGLEHTWFAAAERPTAPRAHGFVDLDGDGMADDLTAALPDTAFLSSAWTAGAIVATSEDVARFTRALFTGELLGETMQQELLTLVARPDGKQHGLGVLHEQHGGTDVYGHRGNSMGFSGVTWHAPEPGITITLLANVHGVVFHPGDMRLLRVAGGEKHSRDEKPHAAARISAAAESSAEDPEQVIRELEPELERNPDDPELLTRLSRAYIQSLSPRSPVRTYQRSKQLVGYLRRAIELDPQTSEPRWLLFSFLLDAPPIVGGDRDEARRVAEGLFDVDRLRGYQALRRYHAKLNNEAEVQRYAELIERLEAK
jgi:D-alanyl-D-alanine carboxypeptidase